VGPCSCCGYEARLVLAEVSWTDGTVALCAVCRDGLAQVQHDLPASHRGMPRALARLANAMLDAHGASFREAVEARLAGDDAPEGTYDAL